MLLFTTGVLWGISTQAKTEHNATDVIVHEDPGATSLTSNNLTPGTIDFPQTSLESIIALVTDLNEKHAAYWINEPGWYYYEYEKLEPELQELTLPNTDSKLTSQHSIEQTWLLVNADKRITNRISVSSELDGTVLQEVVQIDGTSINLTGYSNPVLHNTAISTDDLYNIRVQDHYLIVELLRGLPQGANVQTWLDESTDPPQYIIHTTQDTGELPPILNLTIKLNYETGQIIHWEGGHLSQEGEYTPKLVLQNIQYLSANNLPESSSALLTEADRLLKEKE
jgi:hypothetical protein